MKISIDTKEDSADDIKKIVKMLQAWLEGHSGSYVNIFDSGSAVSGQSSSDSQPDIAPGLFNIFGDSNSESSGSEVAPGSVLDFGSDKYDPDDSPKIITY